MKITIHAHCSDRCMITSDQESVGPDYVPIIKGIGGGDDVRITIDTETGRVVGLDAKALEAVFKEVLEYDEF